MNNTEQESQPIKNEQSGSAQTWSLIASKVINSINVPNVDKDPNGAIEAMESLHRMNELISVINNIELSIARILTAAKVSTVDEVVQMLDRKDLEGIAVEHHIGGDADTFVKEHRGNLQGKERFELLSMLKDFAVTSCIKYHQHFAKHPLSNEHLLNLFNTATCNGQREMTFERFRDALLVVQKPISNEWVKDLEHKLNQAIERMDRARNILNKQDGVSNWGMLDTSDLLPHDIKK